MKAPETTVTALSANSIHVRWKPLNKSDAQGRVIGYQIFCREFDIEETEVKHIVESNITEHTITGKINYFVFRFVVLGVFYVLCECFILAIVH